MGGAEWQAHRHIGHAGCVAVAHRHTRSTWRGTMFCDIISRDVDVITVLI